MAYVKLAFSHRPLHAGETPQAVFEHLAADYSFLLESGSDGLARRGTGRPSSADSSATTSGRYSFIGYDPFMFAQSANGITHSIQRKNFCDIKKSAVRQMADGDPLEVLREAFQKFSFNGDAPVPFCGGAAGYFSYDYGCGFAGVTQKVFDDTHIPDYSFSFVDKVIAFDHQKKEILFLALADSDMAAKRKVEEIDNDLKRPVPLFRKGQTGAISSNLTKKQYVEKIGALKKLLRDGETYQVNFSQRYSGECTVEPWVAYKKLAAKSPAPFACYFQYPEFAIVSSSPELLLRKRKDTVETWPVKGTIRRGKNSLEDAKLVTELLESKKDAAELAMIVDLERNDLGKVCVPGSIKVLEHRAIQKLSHVTHTFSRVEGKLSLQKDVFDVLKALFPGGSITGCPKKRTISIIDRLEDYKRGVYTGSAGYFSFSGDSDFNILIRTMLLKDNKIYFHSGGGIVIDSDAEKEYEETLHKSEAMREVF